ncbi:MAG: endonuclease domain-containing protein [Bacteroidetes bacterium]|nr:MAG: endonuclease domain-containing protein [Bacteroidota bacterium]
MFEGASHLIFEHAKRLRKNMTEAEKILWMYLRDGINGFKFRRQHPVGNYIADFFCHKAKLIVELDGSVHNNEDVKNNDIQRQNDLQLLGYNIIRFNNDDVFKNVEKVIEQIQKKVNNIINNKAPGIGV